MLEIGVQLYALRREIEADFEGAIRSIPDLGCGGVELARLGEISAKAWREALDAAGLSTLGAHVRIEELEQQWPEKADFLRVLGSDRIVVPAPQPGWETAGEAEYRETAERLNALGRRAREEGFELAYHNHHWEFEGFGGDAEGLCGMDVLWQDTDPELVGWEIDTAWATKGGWDPVEMLRKQADRVVMVHAKEYCAVDASEPPMGEGDVDFVAVVDLAKQYEWPLVIEYEGDPAPAGVAQSAAYLKSLLEPLT